MFYVYKALKRTVFKALQRTSGMGINASEMRRDMGGEKRLNNAGLSLLELIVVVLIMGIMAGSVVIGLSAVYNAKAERAASVSASVMKRARQKALSLDEDSEVYVEFSFESNTYVGRVYVDNSTTSIHQELAVEKIGNDQLTLTFSKHNVSGADVSVSSTQSVRIYFKKSTGGITKVEKVVSGTGTSFAADQLKITGSSDDKTIILGGETGRCYLTE